MFPFISSNLDDVTGRKRNFNYKRYPFVYYGHHLVYRLLYDFEVVFL